jgi:hypothetical protein
MCETLRDISRQCEKLRDIAGNCEKLRESLLTRLSGTWHVAIVCGVAEICWRFGVAFHSHLLGRRVLLGFGEFVRTRRGHRTYKQHETFDKDVRILGYCADDGVRLQSYGTAPRTRCNRSTSTRPQILQCCQHQSKNESFLHRMSKIGQHSFICSQGRKIEYHVCKCIA